ncbi:MAG: ATP-binding protein [Bacteroidota bacterium]
MNIFETFLNHPLIPLFIVANLAISYWAHRKATTNSFEDYAVASRNLPTGVLLMTILATLVSDRELSLMDATLEFGIITFTLNLACYIISMFFIGFMIAPRLVFYQSPTLGGVMKELYGKGAQLLTGIMHCFFSLFLLISLIASIGIISEKLLGMPFIMGVVFFGMMVVLYSTLGGIRSVSYTDVLQLVLLLFVLFWVVQKIMAQSGGIAPLVRQVEFQYPDKLAIFSHPDFWLLTRLILGYFLLSFYIFMSPPLVHRMLMVRDKNSVSHTWYTSALVYAIIFTMFMMVGLFGMTKNEAWALAKNKNVFINLIKNLFEKHPRTVELIALSIIGILLSTMDSLLHTMGITAVKDVLEPIQNLLGKKGLNERNQVNYSKITVLIIGIVTIAIGSKIEHTSARYIRRVLLKPMKSLQVIVTIPFILGVIGLKTDKRSFISFIASYLSIFYAQKLFFPWRAALKHRADVDYFLIALPLGLLAYFLTHIYVNGGIATVKRGKNYTAHTTLKPSWEKIKKKIVAYLQSVFNLADLARFEVGRRPAYPLTFSVFMFALYGLSSGIGGAEDEGYADFMAVIYFIGISLCAGLMVEGIWPLRLKSYFPLYWLTTLFFCLPLGGTLAFLRVHDGFPHTMLFFVSFVILAFLVSSQAFIWMSIAGISLAWGGWYVLYGALPDGLSSIIHVGAYIELAILTLCILFFGNYFETYTSQQFYLKKVFGKALTHEAKQPLSEISIACYLQEKTIAALTPTQNEAGKNGFFIPEEEVYSLKKGIEGIDEALKEMKRDFMHFENVISEELGQVPREKVYIKSLIDFIVLTLPKRYTSKVEVKVECKKDFQAMMVRPFFYNVLSNFLLNAFKHGLATEMVIQIDGDERKVRVRDNGRGIPAEVVPNIFTFRFTTEEGERSKGVGLAFVKLILEASNIKIDTTSKTGEGSFTEFVLDFSKL